MHWDIFKWVFIRRIRIVKNEEKGEEFHRGMTGCKKEAFSILWLENGIHTFHLEFIYIVLDIGFILQSKERTKNA